ncbi:MAG: hypothetical protein R3D30_05820 [Hyphomicrobiales bacterium]
MLRAKPNLMPETAPTLRAHVTVAGHDLKPLVAGALYWEAEDTLLRRSPFGERRGLRR